MLIDFPFSILIVDDHSIFRRAIVDILKELSEQCLVEEASNGIECLACLNKRPYDLVLLDINMPEMNGIECLVIIQKKWPHQKVAALTQYDQAGFLRRMRELGAVGYLLKGLTAEELQRSVMSMIIENVTLYNDKVDHDLTNIKHLLSRREIQVLTHMTNDLSSEDIAIKLNISENTVNNHRVSILSKLKLKNTTSAVKWALQNGFTTKLEI